MNREHSSIKPSTSKSKVLKENSVVWWTVCTIFSKFSIERTIACKFLYRNLNLRVVLPSQKTISLLSNITKSLNIQIDKFVYRSYLKKNNSCVFSIRSFKVPVNQFILTATVNLSHRKSHHLFKNPFYDANKCLIFESNYDV